jgi:hypothetical protein
VFEAVMNLTPRRNAYRLAVNRAGRLYLAALDAKNAEREAAEALDTIPLTHSARGDFCERMRARMEQVGASDFKSMRERIAAEVVSLRRLG